MAERTPTTRGPSNFRRGKPSIPPGLPMLPQRRGAAGNGTISGSNGAVAGGRTQMPNTDPWGDPSPPFLAKLDSDPVRAKAEFCEFSAAFLTAHPPPALVRLGDYGSRQGFIWEFNERMCADDFRRLRTYENRGLPFAGWLWVSASNWFRDELEKYTRPERLTVAESQLQRPDGAPIPTEEFPDPGKSPEERAREDELRRRIGRALLKLRPLCIRLLWLDSLGYRPREMQKDVQQLGMGTLTNVQISERLRACKAHLKNLLIEGGAE